MPRCRTSVGHRVLGPGLDICCHQVSAARHTVTLGSCAFGVFLAEGPSDLVAAAAGPMPLTEAGWIVHRCSSLHADTDLSLKLNVSSNCIQRQKQASIGNRRPSLLPFPFPFP